MPRFMELSVEFKAGNDTTLSEPSSYTPPRQASLRPPAPDDIEEPGKAPSIPAGVHAEVKSQVSAVPRAGLFLQNGTFAMQCN